MAEPTLTPAQRAQVVAFAHRHGPTQAARRYGVPLGSVKTWQARARARERSAQAWAAAAAEARPAELPDPDPTETTIAERMAAGSCLRCGGQGVVTIPAVIRGSLVLSSARRMRCPNCGGVPRRIQVNELPAGAWAEGMRVAGDAGLGWNEREWRMIRGGQPNPDGYRWTGRDTPGGGQ
jgi:hypothetical protein